MLEQLLNMTNASFNNEEREEMQGRSSPAHPALSCSSLGVNSPGQGHPGVLHHLVQPGKVSLELVPAVLAANAAPLGLIGRMQTGQGVLHREVAQWRARLARDSLFLLWGQASPSREGF